MSPGRLLFLPSNSRLAVVVLAAVAAAVLIVVAAAVLAVVLAVVAAAVLAVVLVVVAAAVLAVILAVILAVVAAAVLTAVAAVSGIVHIIVIVVHGIIPPDKLFGFVTGLVCLFIHVIFIM